MNHLVQPKILGQAILQRDRSSRGKSCLEQGKNFAFELELQYSKFNFSIFETLELHSFYFRVSNLMSSNVSKFKFQVSSKPPELHSFYFQVSNLMPHQVCHRCLFFPLLTKLRPIFDDPDPKANQ